MGAAGVVHGPTLVVKIRTFTCPACDKPQRVIVLPKRYYRCTFCATETKSLVARRFLSNPDLKAQYDAQGTRRKGKK